MNMSMRMRDGRTRVCAAWACACLVAGVARAEWIDYSTALEVPDDNTAGTLLGPDIQWYESYSPTYGSEGELLGTWGPDARDVDPETIEGTEPSTANLDVFHGLDANGDWTLHLADVYSSGDGTLTAWGLNIVTAPIPEPATTGLLGLLAGRRVRRRV